MSGGIFSEIDAQETPILNPSEGDILGGVRLVKKLGEGSMATVYRAELVDGGAPLAVKVLKAELCFNLDAMRRFDKEALVAKRVRHPSLVEISDVFHPEGYPPVLIMELLEGDDLSVAVANRGSLPVDQTIEIAIQLCGALEALHGQSIVHRDLKPENVFLVGGADGYPIVKLLDFGLVKDLYGGDPFLHTQPGATIGTPAFMAPEQFSGSHKADSLVDIYALGAVMYEMLTGRPPFLADTYKERVQLVMSQDPQAPSAVAPPKDPPIPAALDALVLRCLARSPQQRIQYAEEVRAVLEQLRDPGAQVTLPPMIRAKGSDLPWIIAGVVGGVVALMLAAWYLL